VWETRAAGWCWSGLPSALGCILCAAGTDHWVLGQIEEGVACAHELQPLSRQGPPAAAMTATAAFAAAAAAAAAAALFTVDQG
jgi:hypothetical protein